MLVFVHPIGEVTFMTNKITSSLDLLMLFFLFFVFFFQLDGLKLTFKKNRRKRKKDAGTCRKRTFRRFTRGVIKFSPFLQHSYLYNLVRDNYQDHY